MNYPPYHKDWPDNGRAIPRHHKQVTVHCPVNDTMVTADEGMIADLQRLWHYGIGTRWSCQGSGYMDGDRYISLENSDDVDAAIEMLPWAFASDDDRKVGAVYARPGGAWCGIFLTSDIETMGDLH